MAGFKPKWKNIAKNLGIDFVVEKLNGSMSRQKKIVQQLARIEKSLDELTNASSGPDKGTQELLSLVYKQLAKQGTILDFDEVEFRKYSQFGEDGILLYIFSLIGTTNRRAVEICAGIGSECNTANLILNHGWYSLLLDGDEKKVDEGRRFFGAHPDSKLHPPMFLHRWIKRENVNSIIEESGFGGEVDLFSLDMDGVDYWIWETITSISPRVIVLEVNVHMGREPVTVPYRDNFQTEWIRVKENTDPSASPATNVLGKWTMYGGASLAAFNKLAEKKGYRLIGSNRIGGNVFFMRKDVGIDMFPKVPEAVCYNKNAQVSVERATKVLLQTELERV